MMLNQSCNHDSLTMVTTTTTPTPTTATTTIDNHDQERLMLETSKEAKGEEEIFSSKENFKRHGMELGGRVWIPEIWGHESYLKEWVDCSAFDSSLVPKGVVLARQALVQECRRANSGRLRIGNRR